MGVVFKGFVPYLFETSITTSVLDVFKRIFNSATESECDVIVPSISEILIVCIDRSTLKRYSTLMIDLSRAILESMRLDPDIVERFSFLVDYLFMFLSIRQSRECITAILDFVYLSPRYIVSHRQKSWLALAIQTFCSSDNLVYKSVLKLLGASGPYIGNRQLSTTNPVRISI
jgi:hypothetical protein